MMESLFISDSHDIKTDEFRSVISSLEQQLGLLDEKIKQMNLVREILQNTMEEIRENGKTDWSLLMQQVTETSLNKSLKQQYLDTSNISARIRLHELYSENEEKWFPWVYRMCGIKTGMKILELGCGNGDFWIRNMDKIPKKLKVTLSDNSLGILDEAKNRFEPGDRRFSFMQIDMNECDLPEEYADLIIANHCLFYSDDIPGTLKQIKKALKKDGIFICSTYGPAHMKEISDLTKAFDDRIVLAAQDLYEIFGKTNGKDILKKEFDSVEWLEYEDALYVTDEKDLIDYITSCHGNQNRYIVDKYREFKEFIKNAVTHSSDGHRGDRPPGFHVTKEAGIFVCR
jgi:ubiquinone/menaquinone biosynthesis C-methylase UbiE